MGKKWAAERQDRPLPINYFMRISPLVNQLLFHKLGIAQQYPLLTESRQGIQTDRE